MVSPIASPVSLQRRCLLTDVHPPAPPGVTKALPDGFQGLVLKPTGNSASNSTSDTQQRSWQAVGGFSELVLWGHDAAPAATDPYMRCIDWLVLADKVSGGGAVVRYAR